MVRRVLPRDEAVAYFKGLGEHYKAEIIGSIPSNEDVSLYREGKFEICAVVCTCPAPASSNFQLMKVAGAYWRATTAMRCCSVSRYGLGDQGRTAAVPSPCWKRRKSATTASWARIGFVPSDEHSPGTVFGIPRAGRFGRRSSNSTCAACIETTATRKSRALLDKTSGKKRAIGTSTAKTCSRRKAKNASTP